ncbi:MAG: peroxiredoxin [Chloroflexota bacterium]
MAIAVGQQAPDFTLVDTENNPVRLADFIGKRNVALFFFPAAFTSVCERQVVAHAAALERFTALDTEVLGVSTDQRQSQKAWLEQCGAKGYRILSDSRRQAAEAYGVARSQGVGNERATFLIDKQGIVRWAKVEAQTGEWVGIDRELEELRAFAG